MSNLKTLLILSVAIFLSVTLSSQKKNLKVVHLKDGTILKGEIIEDTDYKIKLVIGTGDTLDVGYKFID